MSKELLRACNLISRFSVLSTELTLPLLTPVMTPVHFFCHDSTMILGEESHSRCDVLKGCGDEDFAHKLRGSAILMSYLLQHSPKADFSTSTSFSTLRESHWDSRGDSIKIAMDLNPGREPRPSVHSPECKVYTLNHHLRRHPLRRALPCQDRLAAATLCHANYLITHFHDAIRDLKRG